MQQEIDGLKVEFEQEIANVDSEKSLEALRVRYLGRKGILAGLFKQLGAASKEDKPLLGKSIHGLQKLVQETLDAKNAEIALSGDELTPAGFDPSLPGRLPWRGNRHVLAAALDDVIAIFHGMGFSVADGPEVELDFYNFQSLNFPDDHPSRDLQDTFYVDNDVLLRTHTSPVQVRYMENNPPPVRIIVPGRVYRNEAIDASHAAEFHQMEGLYVDKSVTLGDLKTTLSHFAREYFGPAAKLRFRPHFFPFTEPSAEADMTCFICGGKGCRVCGNTGWIEILGAGMVHPNVFSSAGYNPEEVTGFAFGFGIERIAMLKYGIEDIRLFLENDTRFLSQF
ncbi:MAG: phenylalanine--tRNA ligase subunit alpha [bacterium]|nr:phenylalanine--tRNA ligase subunit alpha [bacterium]